MANKPHRHQEEPQFRQSTMPSFLINCYLMLMFSFFPLFLTEEYGHARTDKFYLYLVLSAIMIISVVSISLADYFAEKKIHKTTLRFMPLSAADAAFLCFCGFAAISTLLSDTPLTALIGSFPGGGGRNNGLLLLTVYLLVYLMITRRFVFKEYVLAIYLIFSSVVAGLAAVNYFYLDPLSVYSGYVDLWKIFDGTASKANVILDFGSTLGNKNIISAFMCLFLPVAVMCLVFAGKRYLRVIGGVTIVFAGWGMLCADSSSGMLGLMIALPMMAIFSARRYASLKRFFLAMAILFGAGKLLRLFSLVMNDVSKGFESIQNFLIYSRKMYVVIAVFFLLFLLMQVFEKKLEPHYPKKTVTVTLIVLTAAGIFAGLGVILWFSVIKPDAPLSESASRLLRFDENWGTHRGYYWIKSLGEYSGFNLVRKLFGTGPDTAYAVMQPYFAEMLEKFDESMTDCVHNEYLNYLITQGALGLLSYLALLGSVFVRAIRRAKFNPVVLIFLSAVICYAVQSFVNLYQPITTPLFFIFLSLTEAMNRQIVLEKE